MLPSAAAAAAAAPQFLLLLLQLAGGGAAPDQRPNFVIFLTDDQDSLLGSLDTMPEVQRLLVAGGMRMDRAFVTTPICCPSRSSLLTGQYAHSHEVFTNNENCSSTQWRRRHEPFTFGKQLQDAGYSTAYVGKYLNKYDGGHVPAGWSRWLGLVRNSRFYNYSVNDDSRLRHHGDSYASDYFTDIVTNESLRFLENWAAGGRRRPFLLVLSFPAPHGPEDAAPQYQADFPNDTRHRTPSYNRAPSPDKEWLLRTLPPMPPLHRRFTDLLQRKRLQTLRSVDHGVARVIRRLHDLGAAADTFVFYTSDHGYHLGQFGLLKGKTTPYEFDIRVPLLVRGPGVPAASACSRPVLNIDLAPTLLELAGVRPARPMDGMSFASLLLPGNATTVAGGWRHAFLVERGKITGRKLAMRERLEARRNFNHSEAADGECSESERRRLSCSSGSRWHCVPDSRQRLVRTRCRRRRCRCRRSVMVQLGRHVWRSCWVWGAGVRCSHATAAGWLRDRRRLRLTQRQLEAMQQRLQQLRAAMRRSKQSLLHAYTCDCGEGGGGRLRLDDVEEAPDGRSIAEALRRRRRRRKRRQRKSRSRSACNLKFMNCFFHDRSHWRTPPLWTEPSICFCGNANNYTYWCARIVSDSVDALYCEFVTGFISYYDMRADPHQLVNRVGQLTFRQRSRLQATLNRLRSCSGDSCFVTYRHHGD